MQTDRRKMSKIVRLFMILFSLNAGILNANTNTVSEINELLQLAEDNSFAISAAQYHELAAKRGIIIAKSGYFPTLNFEAIDTKGFPGSSGWIGVEGLMGSPFRKGFSEGLVAKQTIYDFGRTRFDVKKSKYEVEYAKQNTKVTAYEIKLLALMAYYDCVQYQALQNIWKDLGAKAEIITKEVKHFVNTGQRSIVDTYLSEIQLQDSKTAQAYFLEKLIGAKHELAIITGLDEHCIACEMRHDDLGLVGSDIYSSPFLARAKADLKIADATLKRDRADLLPKIITVGSIGTLESTHILPRQNYSIGLGVIMPIYDLHSVGLVKRAKAIVDERNEDVAAQVQFLEETNAKYDTIINSSTVRLKQLEHELILANKGFEVAKDRYFKLEGAIIDLREALRDLARISVESEDSRTMLLKARGSKYLLNGGCS